MDGRKARHTILPCSLKNDKIRPNGVGAGAGNE